MAYATLIIFSALILFYSSTFRSVICQPAPEPAQETKPTPTPTPTSAPLPPTLSPSPLTPITPPPSVAPSTPLTPAPSPASETCPRDMLKLGVCANVMGIPIGEKKPCCALLKGMVDFEVAVCLCTALKANVIGVNLNVPIALSLILSACQKTIPLGFQCA